MIDLPTLQRNLADCIQQLPVQAVHMNRPFYVKLNATTDIMQTLDGGTLDNMSIQVVGVKADFGSVLPKSGDDFDLLMDGASEWITFQVRDVPDYYDPLSPTIIINLQSVRKGIA